MINCNSNNNNNKINIYLIKIMKINYKIKVI